MERKITRKVKVGSVYVGGDSPVSIQSMTNTDTRDVEATLAQIRALHVASFENSETVIMPSQFFSIFGISSINIFK